MRYFKVSSIEGDSYYDSEDEDAPGYLADQVISSVKNGRTIAIIGQPKMTDEEYKKWREG